MVYSSLKDTISTSKAAITRGRESLRYQVKGTKVEVIELAPPYVQTELMGSRWRPIRERCR